ncbi:MAG: hypothetical protein WA941_07875 [Nitrososphaeraceae archaeon]
MNVVGRDGMARESDSREHNLKINRRVIWRHAKMLFLCTILGVSTIGCLTQGSQAPTSAPSQTEESVSEGFSPNLRDIFVSYDSNDVPGDNLIEEFILHNSENTDVEICLCEIGIRDGTVSKDGLNLLESALEEYGEDAILYLLEIKNNMNQERPPEEQLTCHDIWGEQVQQLAELAQFNRDLTEKALAANLDVTDEIYVYAKDRGFGYETAFNFAFERFKQCDKNQVKELIDTLYPCTIEQRNVILEYIGNEITENKLQIVEFLQSVNGIDILRGRITPEQEKILLNKNNKWFIESYCKGDDNPNMLEIERLSGMLDDDNLFEKVLLEYVKDRGGKIYLSGGATRVYFEGNEFASFSKKRNGPGIFDEIIIYNMPGVTFEKKHYCDINGWKQTPTEKYPADVSYTYYYPCSCSESKGQPIFVKEGSAKIIRLDDDKLIPVVSDGVWDCIQGEAIVYNLQLNLDKETIDQYAVAKKINLSRYVVPDDSCSELDININPSIGFLSIDLYLSDGTEYDAGLLFEYKDGEFKSKTDFISFYSQIKHSYPDMTMKDAQAFYDIMVDIMSEIMESDYFGVYFGASQMS